MLLFYSGIPTGSGFTRVKPRGADVKYKIYYVFKKIKLLFTSNFISFFLDVKVSRLGTFSKTTTQ